MVRWEPGTAERLGQSALELFAARGFDQTTAADIADAVGLTERTFFRHFADKREVLFHGQEEFAALFVDGVRAAPADADAFGLVAAALDGAAEAFPDARRPHARARQQVIAQNEALAEREAAKLAHLADDLTAAIRKRGVDDAAAALAGETAVAVFRVAFLRWLDDEETAPLAEIHARLLGRLRALLAPSRHD